MSKKIKILFRPSDLSGVGHFRSIWPAQDMQKNHSDKFDIKINNNPNYDDIESLKKYDIIHFHREFGPQGKTEEFFKELRDAGVKLIMDIDDYWAPSPSHPMYHAAKMDGLTDRIINTIKNADYITTTTDIFADEIRKYNKNVFVIPNAIDPNHKMWQNQDVEKGDKLRISWIGGSSHLKDLELIKDSMSKLNHDESVKDMYQIILCGFDTRGHITMIDQNGNKKTRKILPHETVWTKFEDIFTSNYSIVDSDYEKHLKEFQNKDYKNKDYNDLNYVRRWTLPLTQYGKHYNYCDVCLAPLEENTFNKVKSELKIIEAGMKKKVLIAQDFGIYKELIKHGENGFLIPKSRNHKDWYKHIKHLINNRDEVERISNNLYEFVKEKYNLSNVTNDRVKIYEQLVKENVKAELVN
jgi:glycosyltransferase involved in cell wall biosynthesis